MSISASLLLLSSLALALMARSAVGVDYCPPLWTHAQLKAGPFCYRLFGVRKTWAEAEAACRRYTLCGVGATAHLVSIASAEEEEFVGSYWREMQGPVQGEDGIWLGYRRTGGASGGVWAWSDHLTSSYRNWGEGVAWEDQPTVGCTQQVASDEYSWPEWKPTTCFIKQHFICKTHAL